VALPEDLRKMCHGKPDATLAVEQIMGLPPASTSSVPHALQVVTFTTPRTELFRPCPGGTDIAAPTCSDTVSPSLDGETAKFLLDNVWSSARPGSPRQAATDGEAPAPGYPFTGMGWTYDWDPNALNHVGVSEFVVRPGARISAISGQTPEKFCAAPGP
jgi:hypothetical protein